MIVKLVNMYKLKQKNPSFRLIKRLLKDKSNSAKLAIYREKKMANMVKN